jgi:hypothetical protein
MTIAGSLVFIPAFVALFSYSYGFFFIFNNVKPAIIGGVASAIVLLIIDRSIMGYGRPGKFSLGMLGRVFLAITVGFLLAEPLILKVFQDSIKEEQFQKVISAKNKNAVKYDNQIAELQKGLSEDQIKLDQLQKAYTAEMDGTGGSKIRNRGPIYQQKYADYLDYQKSYNTEQTTIAAEIAEIQKQKSQELELVEQNNADGLMGRMRALTALGEKEPVVRWTTWLLRCFFIFIELLPLLIKISPTGDCGLYIKLIDMNDEEKEKTYEMLSKERLELNQQEEKFRLTKAFAEICHKEVDIITTYKQKDSIYLMTKAQEMSDKKIDFIGRAIKTIKDPSMLNEVLAQIERVYSGYMDIINQLTTKSNNNFSTDK